MPCGGQSQPLPTLATALTGYTAHSDFAFGPESSMDFVSRRALAILPSCHVLTLAKFGLRRTSFTLYRSSFTPYGYSSSLEGAYHGIVRTFAVSRPD